jgi:predicted thioesterase
MTIENIPIGLRSEAVEDVTTERTASHIGSGTLPVYATPVMVALIERTCVGMLNPLLPDDTTTVGVEIQVRHLAPTPLGGKIRIKVEVSDIQQNIIYFQATIWDDAELVGEGEHRRAVIDVDRFLQRVQSKTEDE